MRLHLFPALNDAYAAWMETDAAGAFARIADQGRAHWEQVGEAMLTLYRRHGGKALHPSPDSVADTIGHLVEANRL
jgi:hypothetical protein